MRWLPVALLVCTATSPAVAGPIETVQYRTTLRTDQPVIALPASNPGETAYSLGGNPAFGVVVTNSPEWQSATPVYPGAGFSNIETGGFTPFTRSDRLDDLNVAGNGRYALDVELRDAVGNVAVVSFSGQFETGWWEGHAFAWLLFDTIPSPDGAGIPPEPIPPSASAWLGQTRYNVRLDNGWAPTYRQNEDGTWSEVWYPADSVPVRNGGYWTEGSGSFHATLTPVQTPEPSTLLLSGIGACGLWFTRRRSRC
ncbi:: VPEP [Gemmata massiliana]|uniref:: VPEP n=1 Tax=Gemmata massiliana TaxID=1210884 RepID=A0A6P2D1S2_9BACT|nr:: VPEP [Gemmata massiliana]